MSATMSAIGQLRLANQHLTHAPFQYAHEAVAWLGAVQAQDYTSAKWSVGLRWSGATQAGVEQALAERRIVRTWALRGTLHLVAAADIRSLLALTAPGLLARTASVYRQRGLDEAAFEKILPLIEKLLQGGRQLMRTELFAALGQHGIDTQGVRGATILYRAALDGLICLGDWRGKQPTYTLLDEWLPAPAAPGQAFDRAGALKSLAQRYFCSHGPATLHDFAWWSGLSMADARAGLEMVKPHLHEEVMAGQPYWLPKAASVVKPASPGIHLLAGFDEYVLGYKDRSAVLAAHDAPQVATTNGLFRPTIVVDGQIAGIWRADLNGLKKGSVAITTELFKPLSKAHQAAVDEAAQRYRAFLMPKA